MNSIKNYRNKELIAYIIANAFVLLLIMNVIDINTTFLSAENISKILDSLLMTSCLSIFAYLGDSILSGDDKDRLIDLWRGRPGEKVFTEIERRNRDKRFTFQQAKERYEDVYSATHKDKKTGSAFENAKWYSIYHKYRNVDMVYNSKRDYLLCRDINMSTYVILVVYVGLSLVCESIYFNWFCIVFEVFMILITNIAARAKAHRMTYNVIAYDLQQVNVNHNLVCDEVEE